MTCERALDALLEADPAELEAGSGSSLVRHLAGCGRCRARATAVLDDTARLGRALDRLVGTAPGGGPDTDDLEAALRAVKAARRRRREDKEAPPPAGSEPAPHAGEVSGTTGSPGSGTVPQRRASPRRWVLPLALAAAAAGLLVVGEPSPPPGGWQSPGPTRPGSVGSEAATPLVESGARRTVAVFETSDPDITVVWFFDEE